MTQQKGNFMESAMMIFGGLANLPAPEKVFAELQRLNNNMERLQPDLHKLATSLEGFNASDLRTLGAQIQGLRVQEMLTSMTEFNSTMKAIYGKLWGKV